ncbi:ATP-grasp domain-containing protein [Streptomyces mirabilis]|uniref:ATP-grasp domain-containing protein n=1 Tax=Streptomyces mirabilis TaxID=68239 RepID=UPI0036AC7A2F
MSEDTAETGPLVVLGGSHRVIEVAAEFDCPIVHVQKPGATVTHLIKGGTRLLTADYTGPAFHSLVEQVLAPLRPQAFVSLAEDGVVAAASANLLLGLPGTPPDVVSRFRDKAHMRQRILECGLDELTVPFAAVESGPHAASVMATWPRGTTAILKPRDGSGSQGIEHITAPAELRTRVDLSRQLLEQYVPGPEYSAETFSVDGGHRLVAVTEKVVDPATFVELGHVTPPPSLTPAELHTIGSAVSRFLDAMGLHDGPAHTEFKLHDNTVKIIESHNRIGGGGISTLTRLVTGIDLVAWGVGWPVGLGAPAADPEPAAPAAAIAFAAARPGTVADISLPDADQAPPAIQVVDISAFVAPGDLVRPLRSSTDRVGCVMASGPAPGPTMAAVTGLARRITVTALDSRQDVTV